VWYTSRRVHPEQDARLQRAEGPSPLPNFLLESRRIRSIRWMMVSQDIPHLRGAGGAVVAVFIQARRSMLAAQRTSWPACRP